VTTTLETARKRWQGRSHALDLSGIDFTVFRAQPLDENVLRSLRYMHDVEHHTVCYLRDLLVTRLHRDPAMTNFLTIWAYEEHWHGEAIGEILQAHEEPGNEERISSVRAHPGVHDRLRPVISQLSTAVLPAMSALHLAWGAVNEWSTQAGYARLSQLAGHPVLSELLGRIMRQEGRHIDFYQREAALRLGESRIARRLTRAALKALWNPVGSGVMPKSEVAFLAGYLFGDAEGLKAAARIDRQIDRLPGLSGLGLLTRASQRLAGAIAPAPAVAS
jgi:hypothetical protein